MDIEKAVKILEQDGFRCLIKEYVSKKPVEADTKRVIRQKETDGRTVQLIVSGFKTQL